MKSVKYIFCDHCGGFFDASEFVFFGDIGEAIGTFKNGKLVISKCDYMENSRIIHNKCNRETMFDLAEYALYISDDGKIVITDYNDLLSLYRLSRLDNLDILSPESLSDVISAVSDGESYKCGDKKVYMTHNVKLILEDTQLTIDLKYYQIVLYDGDSPHYCDIDGHELIRSDKFFIPLFNKMAIIDKKTKEVIEW